MQAPNHPKNERFGYKLDFSNNKLCVLGVNGRNIDKTTFDSNLTIFDNNTTRLLNISTRSYQAYTFELLNDRILLVKQLTMKVTIHKSKWRSYSKRFIGARDVEIEYQDNHLYLGFEGIDTNNNKRGIIFDLRANRDAVNWTTLGAATDFIDYNKMRGTFLYDRQTSDSITYLDAIDPIQGKIANAAEKELDYKLYYTSGSL